MSVIVHSQYLRHYGRGDFAGLAEAVLCCRCPLVHHQGMHKIAWLARPWFLFLVTSAVVLTTSSGCDDSRSVEATVLPNEDGVTVLFRDQQLYYWTCKGAFRLLKESESKADVYEPLDNEIESAAFIDGEFSPLSYGCDQRYCTPVSEDGEELSAREYTEVGQREAPAGSFSESTQVPELVSTFYSGKVRIEYAVHRSASCDDEPIEGAVESVIP